MISTSLFALMRYLSAQMPSGNATGILITVWSYIFNCRKRNQNLNVHAPSPKSVTKTEVGIGNGIGIEIGIGIAHVTGIVGTGIGIVTGVEIGIVTLTGKSVGIEIWIRTGGKRRSKKRTGKVRVKEAKEMMQCLRRRLKQTVKISPDAHGAGKTSSYSCLV